MGINSEINTPDYTYATIKFHRIRWIQTGFNNIFVYIMEVQHFDFIVFNSIFKQFIKN